MLTLNASSNGGDASRVGKRFSYYLVYFVFPSFLYPDARRVAPISACVFLQRVSCKSVTMCFEFIPDSNIGKYI